MNLTIHPVLSNQIGSQSQQLNASNSKSYKKEIAFGMKVKGGFQDVMREAHYLFPRKVDLLLSKARKQSGKDNSLRMFLKQDYEGDNAGNNAGIRLHIRSTKYPKECLETHYPLKSFKDSDHESMMKDVLADAEYWFRHKGKALRMLKRESKNRAAKIKKEQEYNQYVNHVGTKIDEFR